MTVHHYPAAWQVDIAGNVRAETARRRMTQTDIAATLGENQQWVSRRMNGSVEWRISELVAIADMLGVHPAVLLGGRAPATPDGGQWAPRGSNPEPTDYATRWGRSGRASHRRGLQLVDSRPALGLPA